MFTKSTVPPSDLANVLARLGPDKYSDFDFDLDHISLNYSFAEYFEGSSQVMLRVLKANISFWQSIGASKFILDTLSFGYKIPFSREPTSVFLFKSYLGLALLFRVLARLTWLIHCPFLYSQVVRRGSY